MRTNEFRSVDMSGYNRSGATIYGSYNSKNTAKDYLFTFYHPDGSEKYLRYNADGRRNRAGHLHFRRWLRF